MTKVEKSKENLKKCICMKCPSYKLGCKMKSMPKNMMTMLKGNISELNHFEGLFCAFENSNCITEESGCICANCELYKENKLDKLYFCTQTEGK
ncbi:MAG: DUF2769 domain-containing protein [Candidatus Aenigmarchaeota archaeon]|nr:DUF2769 domain-containing protein [Candidatus Aenigmarchaeota archaeon]